MSTALLVASSRVELATSEREWGMRSLSMRPLMRSPPNANLAHHRLLAVGELAGGVLADGELAWCEPARYSRLVSRCGAGLPLVHSRG